MPWRARFYRALGESTGTSLVEEDHVATAKRLLDAAPGRRADLRLPVDAVIAEQAVDGAPTQVVAWKAIPDGWMVVDVGPDTVASIAADCASAGTIIWNGPLGIYEIPAFAAGTRDVALAVGGVERRRRSSAAVTSRRPSQKAGVADKIGFISTGGGATIEFLEGRIAPRRGSLARPRGRAPLTGGSMGSAGSPLMVAGNWKMNTTVDEGVALARAVRAAVEPARGVEVAVLPPFTHLWAGAIRARGIRRCCSARRTCSGRSPARTPARSRRRCWPACCDLALVGHSERRHIFGERDDEVGRKFAAALAHGLRVILAVGETGDERDAGQTFAVVDRQLDAVFGDARASRRRRRAS